MYECRTRLRGKTPAASTGGASATLVSTVSGRIGTRQRQRSQLGSFSGSPSISTTAKIVCHPEA
jgi:hypothetical protein